MPITAGSVWAASPSRMFRIICGVTPVHQPIWMRSSRTGLKRNSYVTDHNAYGTLQSVLHFFCLRPLSAGINGRNHATHLRAITQITMAVVSIIHYGSHGGHPGATRGRTGFAGHSYS